MSEYKNLRTLFHISDKEAESTYQERFNSKDAVQLPFKIEGSQAFYIMDAEVYRLIIQTERLDKQIREILTRLPEPAIKQYVNRCLIDEIVLTNEIEGVHSSRQEIGKVLERLRQQDKSGRFQGIVQKYLALTSGGTVKLSSSQDIRALYNDLVLDEVIREDAKNAPDGEIFRKGPTHVIDETGRAIHHGIEPESSIIELTDQALSILMNEETELIVRTSIFHFMFSYIHPFYDGNGRTNRFISSYVLAHQFSPLPGLRLSYAIKEHIGEYYKAFSTVEHPLNRGDLTPFIISFAQIIVVAMESMRNSLKENEVSYRVIRELTNLAIPDEMAQEAINGLIDILVQSTLFSERGATAKDLAQAQGVSVATIYNRIKRLDAYELIKRERFGKEVFFSLDLQQLTDLVD